MQLKSDLWYSDLHYMYVLVEAGVVVYITTHTHVHMPSVTGMQEEKACRVK